MFPALCKQSACFFNTRRRAQHIGRGGRDGVRAREQPSQPADHRRTSLPSSPTTIPTSVVSGMFARAMVSA